MPAVYKCAKHKESKIHLECKDKCAKHREGKIHLESKEKCEHDIAATMKAYNNEVHPKGDT